MRTTVDLDEDIYLAVKARARRERRSAGAVLSELARTALHGAAEDDGPARLGFRPLGSRGVVVTNELIDRIREEESA
ncbi:MAG: hypothetical protein ACRCYQ_05330 [Nocardioides sp.]